MVAGIIRQCSFPQCGRTSWAAGLCTGHYRQKRGGKELRSLRVICTTEGCSFPNCGHPHHALGLCKSHRQQQRKGEELRALRVIPPPEERFWSYVNKSGPVAVPRLGRCWVWRGYKESSGYGWFHLAGRPRAAHIVAWELSVGPVPEGLCALHRCDNPPCVNPDHLFLGTRADNNRDCLGKGRYHHKLSSLQVERIQQRYAAGGVSYSALADAYGVSQTTIGLVIRGKTHLVEGRVDTP